MKIIILLLTLLIITACSQTTFEWSEGECQTKEDCQPTEYGCGPDHLKCTSNPEQLKNIFSTCEIITNHPIKKGYKCTCINNKCGWKK